MERTDPRRAGPTRRRPFPLAASLRPAASSVLIRRRPPQQPEEAKLLYFFLGLVLVSHSVFFVFQRALTASFPLVR